MEEPKTNSLVEAITNIGTSFEQFKKVNDQKLEEERKGNEARARELTETLEKISAELTTSVKTKEILERRINSLNDRADVLEAMNDRPRASVQDKLRSEHKDLFVQWLRGRGMNAQVEQKYQELIRKAGEYKDVTIGSTTGGGFALPEEIYRTVDKLLLKTSAITQYVRNVTVGSPDYKELLTINGATYAWSAETGTRSATVTPGLRERAPTWGELYAYATASNWSLEDLFFDVVSWLVDAITEGFTMGLSAALWNGNGSSKPTGFINTAPVSTADYASPMRSQEAFQYVPLPAAGSSPFTTTGLTTDAVIALTYALNPRYRGNAQYAANTITQGALRRLKDTTGQYLWQPSLQAGQPDRLLGYTLFTWEDMSNPTTANGYPLAFGDFNQAYILATRTGVQIVRDNITAAGFTKFYIARRYGGILKNNDALKFAKVSLS